MKTCNKCEESKELSEFAPDSRNKDGRQGICLECRKIQKKQFRERLQKDGPLLSIEEKRCNKCNELKSIDLFFKDSGFSDGRSSVCKLCKTSTTMKWREQNKSKYNNSAKGWRKNNPTKLYASEIKRRYKCSLEEYNQRLVKQNGKCKICGELHDPANKRKRLFVDHCHNSEKIRGLLCHRCNCMLGYARDNPDVLIEGAAYLKTPAQDS